MEALAHKIAGWLVKHGADKENEEVFAYGILAVLYELFLNPLILLAALIAGKPVEMILWTVFYIPLRRNMGGKHAANSNICFITSFFIGIATIFLIDFFARYNWILVLDAIFCLFVAFKYAPALHPNHPYPDKWKTKAKQKSRLYAIIDSAVIAILYFLGLCTYAHAVGVAVFTVSALCLWGKYS